MITEVSGGRRTGGVEEEWTDRSRSSALGRGRRWAVFRRLFCRRFWLENWGAKSARRASLTAAQEDLKV